MECATSDGLFTKGMPYRATRMWNDIVRNFKEGIELRKKRWRMKYYYNCFSGSEALAWVHEYLQSNPNYGRNVTRAQAQLLCQKFLHQNVLKDILPSSHMSGTIFEESRLYSFTEKSKCKKEHSSIDEMKENQPCPKTASTRRGTPVSKKRSSVARNESRKPLGERTKLTNIMNQAATEKGGKQKVTERKNDCQENNLVLVNKCARTRRLTRKWKSECNVSLAGKQVVEKAAILTEQLSAPSPCKKSKTAKLPATLLPKYLNKVVADTTLSPWSLNEVAGTSMEDCSDNSNTPSTNTEEVSKAENKDSVPAATNHKEMTQVQEFNELWKDVCLERLKNALKVSSISNILNCDLLSWTNVKENVKSNSKLVLRIVPTWLIAAMKYLIHWPRSKDLPGVGPDYSGFEKDVFKTISDHFQSMKEPLVPSCFLETFTKISGLSTRCKLSAIRACQHTILLLHTDNKQQLQLLLRFMIKVSKNHALNLSDHLPTRELVIQTFAPCIFGGQQSSGLAEVLGIRIASFVMDNYAEVFKVPTGFQYDVEQRIAFCQRTGSGRQGEVAIGPVTFSQRITKQEYEEEKRFLTQRSLEELLDRIVEDQNMNEKDRAKKLKQFQKIYPEIYFGRYPEDGLSTLSHESNSLRHAIKPLVGSILKTLR